MRFRLYPTAEQEEALLIHCSHARYVWNLAVEQFVYSNRDRRMPCHAEQSRQLTEARDASEWLRAGSAVAQHQALRDFWRSMSAWFARRSDPPTWRSKRSSEGFCISMSRQQPIKMASRRWGTVAIPKVGAVKFRLSAALPAAKTYRVKRTADGRWFISFMTIPDGIAGPEDGSVVGVDRGIAVTIMCSDGAFHQAPQPVSVARASRRLARCKRGSKRRARAKARLAILHETNTARRKDFIEKSSTELARRYDTIRIEDLRVRNMTRSAKGTVEKPGRNVRQKAGLNRSILKAGWTLFATRLEQKAPGRVEKVNARFTSQRCSVCGHVDSNSRKSQALFECTSCGYTANADLNASRNIAAGHAVTARGAGPLSALNREPQHAAPAA